MSQVRFGTTKSGSKSRIGRERSGAVERAGSCGTPLHTMRFPRTERQRWCHSHRDIGTSRSCLIWKPLVAGHFRTPSVLAEDILFEVCRGNVKRKVLHLAIVPDRIYNSAVFKFRPNWGKMGNVSLALVCLSRSVLAATTRKFSFLQTLVIVFLCCVPSMADSVLLGAPLDTSVQQGYLIGQGTGGYQFLADAISLNQSVNATSVDVVVTGFTSLDSMLMQLIDGLSIGADVLASQTVSFSGVNTASTVASLTLDKLLNPGTYYVVLSSSSFDTLAAAYNFNNPTVPFTSPLGSISGYYYSNFAVGGANPTDPVASVWSGPQQGSLELQLRGDIATAAPEPNSVLLLAAGLGSLGLLGPRRRKSRFVKEQ